MQSRNKDIGIVLAIVLLNVVWTLLPLHVAWVGVVLALPMVFFVPGYTLTEVLTHTRGLDIFYRLTLSLGLSITLDILGGLLLNVFPFGLRAASWIALLSLLTLLFAVILFLLRRRTYSSSAGVATPQTGFVLAQNRFVLVRDGLLFAFALTLVISSLVYATRGVAQQPRAGFTQLWMLPASHSAPSCDLNIGLHSFENETVTYSAVMTSNGTSTMLWSQLVLEPDQTWQASVTAKPTETVKTLFVQVKLYRSDKPEAVYREVHTTLAVVTSTQQGVSCTENT